MFKGDRSHFYDQLRDRYGLGVVQTCWACYLVGLAFAVLALGISRLELLPALVAAIAALSVALVFVLRHGFLGREPASV